MGWSADLPVGPLTFPFVLWAALGAHLSMVCDLTLFVLVFFSSGPSDPCEARVMMFDRAAFAPSLNKV